MSIHVLDTGSALRFPDQIFLALKPHLAVFQRLTSCLVQTVSVQKKQ